MTDILDKTTSSFQSFLLFSDEWLLGHISLQVLESKFNLYLKELELDSRLFKIEVTMDRVFIVETRNYTIVYDSYKFKIKS